MTGGPEPDRRRQLTPRRRRRDASRWLQQLQPFPHRIPKIAVSSALTNSGSLAQLSTWLSEWTFRHNDNQGNVRLEALGKSVHESNLVPYWTYSPDLGEMSRWFCHLLSAEERLGLCTPPGSIALTTQSPEHPIHYLQRDDELETRLSDKFREAFGVGLVVHRNAGSQVPIHVGEEPARGPGEDRVSISYLRRLELLPTLHTQGDGMKSFAGVLLATSVGRESIVLIDEPEAFLHPPQARLLGRGLVEDRNSNRQLFIATHSSDVLRGVLDTNSPSVRVLRISRSGQSNEVRVLNNSEIQKLWADPLLRYSNVLDGLFHEGVVVCEGDSDCRFYDAILDAAVSAGEHTRADLMFVHCGGKGRIPMVLRALRAVGVPVQAIVDFDVLSDEHPLQAIVEALGLDWEQVRPDWSRVKSAVDDKKPDLSIDEVREKVATVLKAVSGKYLPDNVRKELAEVLKRSSSWAHAKAGGKAFVPAGESTKACNRLFTLLRNSGLHIVPVGELESFCRDDGGHGPQWVNAVLGRDLVADQCLQEARQFVLGILKPASGHVVEGTS